MADNSVSTLGALAAEWAGLAAVKGLTSELVNQLQIRGEPFLGSPLPEELHAGRLPMGIASAWLFILKPETATSPHRHPNSIQHMALLSGECLCTIGGLAPKKMTPIDKSAPERGILVIPKNVSHGFRTGSDPVVVISFHTVPPAELIEIDVASGTARSYVK